MSQTQPVTHSNSCAFITDHLARAGQRRAHIQRLEDDICALAAHIDAAMFRWLELLRGFTNARAGRGTASSPGRTG